MRFFWAKIDGYEYGCMWIGFEFMDLFMDVLKFLEIFVDFAWMYWNIWKFLWILYGCNPKNPYVFMAISRSQGLTYPPLRPVSVSWSCPPPWQVPPVVSPTGLSQAQNRTTRPSMKQSSSNEDESWYLVYLFYSTKKFCHLQYLVFKHSHEGETYPDMWHRFRAEEARTEVAVITEQGQEWK